MVTVRFSLVRCAVAGALVIAGSSACSRSAGGGPTHPAAATIARPVAADVPDYRGELSRRGIMPGPGPASRPTVLWRHPTSSAQSLPVAVSGGQVLVPDGSSLTAVDLATGTTAWHTRLAGPVSGPVTVSGGTILAAVGADLVQAIARSDRHELWRVHHAAIGTQISVVGGSAYFGTNSGGFEAASLSSGARQWQVHVGWSNTKHAIVGDMAYLGGDGGARVTAVSLVTHRVKWRFDTGGDRVLTPAVADGRVFVAGVAANAGSGGRTALLALDAATGRREWSFTPPGDPPMASFAVGDRDVFIGQDSEPSTLYAVNLATGAVHWQVPIDQAVDRPVIVGDVLYIGTGTGGLHAYDLATGRALWQVKIGGYSEGVAITGGTSIMASRNAADAPGEVTALVAR